MAAAANITLQSKAGVDRVFSPFRVSGDEAEYVYRPAGGSFASWHRLRLTRKSPANLASGVTRAAFSLEIPVLDATTGLVKATCRFKGEYLIPSLADQTSVDDLETYVDGFTANAIESDLGTAGVLPT